MFSKYLKNLILSILFVKSIMTMEEREPKRQRSFKNLQCSVLKESKNRFVSNSTKLSKKRCTLKSLPTELKMLIVQFLVSSPKNISQFKSFIANLRNLAQVNREFYNIANDLNFIKYLINLLDKIKLTKNKTKKYYTWSKASTCHKNIRIKKIRRSKILNNKIEKAYLIKTRGAIEWLKTQEKEQSKKTRKLLDQFLNEAITNSDIKKVYFALLVEIAIDNKIELFKVDNIIEAAFVTINQNVIKWLQEELHEYAWINKSESIIEDLIKESHDIILKNEKSFPKFIKRPFCFDNHEVPLIIQAQVKQKARIIEKPWYKIKRLIEKYLINAIENNDKLRVNFVLALSSNALIITTYTYTGEQVKESLLDEGVLALACQFFKLICLSKNNT